MTGICPVCENHNSQNNQQPYMGKSTSFLPLTIQNCKHCGLGLADPMPSTAELDEYYNGQYWVDPGLPFTPKNYPTTYVLALSRWQQLQPLLEKSSTDSNTKRILDIGAGHGFLGTIAAESSVMENGEYHAVEPDEDYRKAVKKYWSSKTCSTHLYKSLEEVDEKFDLIAISHVLEHVAAPVDFINHISTYLKPNGLLFLEIPHRDDRFKEDVFPHLLFFTNKALESLIKKCGLSVITIETRGIKAQNSVLSCSVSGLRYYLPKIWHRLGKILPDHLNLLYYKWLLAPEVRHPEGAWLRGVAQKKDF